jgi:mRNA interferase RelE/StbE
MPQYKIEWKKSAVKELTLIPKETAAKIYENISQLSLNPYPLGSKKLKGAKNLYRLRIGDYRVIYSIYNEELVVQIIKIAHRKIAYRN